MENNNKISKNLRLLILLSITACIGYSILLLTDLNYYLYTTIAKIILFCLFPIMYFKIVKTGSFYDLIRIKGNKKYIKLSIILGVATCLVIIFGFIILRKMFDDATILNSLKNQGITNKNFPFVFLNIIFVNALLEEVFFRGFVFLTIYKMGYKKLAYCFSAILFSLYHLTMLNGWFSPIIMTICIIGLVIGGLIFDEISRRCENIYGGYFVHIGANLGINLIGLYLFLIN